MGAVKWSQKSCNKQNWYLARNCLYLLVYSVKLPKLRSVCGIRIPNPAWPHCPNCKLIGLDDPKIGWSEVTRKSGWGLVLILSLMGRSLRQSVPDHEAGNKTLMLSNLAFLSDDLNTLWEVAVKSFWNIKYRYSLGVVLSIWLSIILRA